MKPWATIGGDPHDGEKLKRLAGVVRTITETHIGSAMAWKKDRDAAREMEGIRAPGEQSRHHMPGIPPTPEQQEAQRKVYHAVRDRLSRARLALSRCPAPALAISGLEMVVIENVVPEMLSCPVAVAALVAGLDALATVYGQRERAAA